MLVVLTVMTLESWPPEAIPSSVGWSSANSFFFAVFFIQAPFPVVATRDLTTDALLDRPGVKVSGISPRAFCCYGSGPGEVDAQATVAYNACMQYTLRNVPPLLDEALRAKAREEGKSLNEVTIEALFVGVGLAGEPVKRRDLSDITGSWVADPAMDEILQEQRRIDPELWR